MAFKLPTMTRESSTSTSTGDMVMAGAQTGYFAASAGLSNGDTTYLTFKMGADTEEGLYTYNSGPNSFTRTTIYRSTNANAAVNWAPGTKDVICGLPGPSNIDAAGLVLLRTILGLNLYDSALTLSTAQQAQERTNTGVDTATLAKSAGYTVVAADYGALIKCTSTFTLAFTAAATLGDKFKVFLRNDGTGVITLDPNGAETIDGALSKVLSPGDSCWVICDGSNFKSVGKTIDSATFAALGHMTFAGGFIVQWGQDTSGSADNTQSFEVTFPNACFAVVATNIALDGSATVSYTVHVSGISTTGFAMRKRSISGTAGPTTNVGNAYWIAVGW